MGDESIGGVQEVVGVGWVWDWYHAGYPGDRVGHPFGATVPDPGTVTAIMVEGGAEIPRINSMDTTHQQHGYHASTA